MGDTLTYLDCSGDWEVIFVNGEVEYENHGGRAWPNRVLDILQEYDIEEVERLWVKDDEAYSAGALVEYNLDVLRELAE